MRLEAEGKGKVMIRLLIIVLIAYFVGAAFPGLARKVGIGA